MARCLINRKNTKCIGNYYVWGFSKGKDIERVHLQFCKKLLAVKQCTQNDFIYGETGRMPLQLRRYFHIIKYWFKVISSANHKYIKATYDMQLRDLNYLPHKSNWASVIAIVLDRNGHADDLSVAKGLKLHDMNLSLLWMLKTNIGFAHNVIFKFWSL